MFMQIDASRRSAPMSFWYVVRFHLRYCLYRHCSHSVSISALRTAAHCVLPRRVMHCPLSLPMPLYASLHSAHCRPWLPPFPFSPRSCSGNTAIRLQRTESHSPHLPYTIRASRSPLFRFRSLNEDHFYYSLHDDCAYSDRILPRVLVDSPTVLSDAFAILAYPSRIYAHRLPSRIAVFAGSQFQSC
jgi:hypothetical protein